MRIGQKIQKLLSEINEIEAAAESYRNQEETTVISLAGSAHITKNDKKIY